MIYVVDKKNDNIKYSIKWLMYRYIVSILSGVYRVKENYSIDCVGT